MNNLLGEYYKNLKKNIYQYASLLSKIISVDHRKILNNKKRTSEILESVIDLYIDKYQTENNTNLELGTIFLNNSYIEKYSLKKEASAITEYFINNNIVFDIEQNEDDIVLLAVILKISNEVDILTSPYQLREINFNKEILNMLEIYHKIEFIFLIDQGKKHTKALIELAKSKCKNQKQFYELLTNRNSFNRYIDITNERKYYIAQYNFYIEELEKYNTEQTKKIYKAKNIDDRFVNISLDCIIISLIKCVSLRKIPEMFFLPVKRKFLMIDRNLKGLVKSINSKYVQKNIKLLINYDEIDSELIKILNREKIDYYVYCNKNPKLNDNYLKINKKYIFSRDFCKNNQKVINELEKEYYQFIEESYDEVLSDNELILIKSEEKK